jgi:curved DNA-binding protein CbpA
VKSYYDILQIAPDASAEDVKRAFRVQIARYHPDKVQHLGTEFQEMAGERAAELTEAYRILSNGPLRAEYDLGRGGTAAFTPQAPAPFESPRPSAEPDAAAGDPAAATAHRAQFTQERASRDVFVRNATIRRFRQALDAMGAGYEQADVSGFDAAFAPKAKLFARGKGPRLLARFVSSVDPQTVGEAFAQAGRSNLSSNEDVCVFLIGSELAPARQLAQAIADGRRRPGTGGRVVLIPVDARDWDAHMPIEAPAIAKTLLARLRTGT